MGAESEEGELAGASDEATSALTSDVLLLNGGMFPVVEDALHQVLADHPVAKNRLILILVTPGGLPDVAYRIAVMLRRRYSHISVCVSGWCKSAGTLVAISGDDLIMGERGEMGPLDVQIAKRDELAGDRDSGLVINEALKRLRSESFELFSEFLARIISESPTLVTFRTAADVAAHLTIGLMAPIFEKIDPLRMGADARAMSIGEEYAIRLNAFGKNLRGAEALNMLLNGYPAHSFVIDLMGAKGLFTRVQPLSGSLAARVDELGADALRPLDAYRVCFLEEDDGGKDGAEEPGEGQLPVADPNDRGDDGGNESSDDGRGDSQASAG